MRWEGSSQLRIIRLHCRPAFAVAEVAAPLQVRTRDLRLSLLHISKSEAEIGNNVVAIISTTDWINITAKQGIRLTGGPSQLVISQDGVNGFTPGENTMHAAITRPSARSVYRLFFRTFPIAPCSRTRGFSLKSSRCALLAPIPEKEPWDMYPPRSDWRDWNERLLDDRAPPRSCRGAGCLG